MTTGALGEAGILGSQETAPSLDSWADFVREFALNAAPNWIFRGHADATWQLVTSLQRAFAARGIADLAERAAFENSAIGFFQERARLHLEQVPDEHDLLGWLGVMQHYGAPTRLQDWTQSPFVAAYFAYREDTGQDGELWALQAFFCRRTLTPVMLGQPWDYLGFLEIVGQDAQGNEVIVRPGVELSQKDAENENLRAAIRGGNGWPLPLLPLAYDARMAAQQAVFVSATQLDFALEALLDKDLWPQPEAPNRFVDQLKQQEAEYPLAEPYQLIKRVRLPYAWRGDALRTLRQMGIAEETLFPGLDGAGRATRMHIEARSLGLRDALQSVGL
ncbi:MAG: FRG domain-containing protein [Solirubrobacteraceae bacterium]